MIPCTLRIEVVDIRGHCPVYKVGDGFQIVDGYKLVAEMPLCMHALQSLAPYYVALSRGVKPTDLGLAGPDGAAYVQCLDPQRYTGGGTVTFRICAEEHGSRGAGNQGWMGAEENSPLHLRTSAQYALLTLHRPSNVDVPEVLSGILDALAEIQARLPILCPAHPRTVRRLQEFGFEARLVAMPNLRVTEPLGYLEFLNLMANARLVLTDSGGIQEETTILGVPL